MSSTKILRKVIQEKKLSIPTGFNEVTEAHLDSCYNGIGPERWSPKFRKAITWALSYLEAPALIHDFEFARGGSYWAFTKANFRLCYNAAKDGHLLSGLTAGVLCQCFGWKGWSK